MAAAGPAAVSAPSSETRKSIPGQQRRSISAAQMGRVPPPEQSRRVTDRIDTVYCEGELDLLPDMSPAEKCRRQATTHAEIAKAVAVARDICNPYRAAESRQRAKRRPNRTRSRCRASPPVKPLRPC